MSRDLHRGVGLLATITLVATACSSQVPTASPTNPPGTGAGATAAPGSTREGSPSAVASEVAQAPTALPTETPTPSVAASLTQAASPQPGGSLVLAEWQPPTTLQPFFTLAFGSYEALGPALRGLLTINDDGQWTPDLGAEVPSIENGGLLPDPHGNGFTLTLRLKPGLLWSDGTPLTMNDFKATYDWAVMVGKANVGCSGCASTVPLIDPSIADADRLWAPENQYVGSITVAADGTTATVVWKRNFSGWLGWASGLILQGRWLSNIAPPQAAASMPVGPGIETVPWNGPFKIVAASNDGIDYDRNTMWHATSPAWLDHLRFKYYADKGGMITAFLNGESDLVFDMTQADFPAVAVVDPSVGMAKLDPVWQYQHFDLQTAHKNVGLDDVRVRTAIAMAVDKQDLVDVLLPGAGLTPACTVAPPGTQWRDETVKCAAYDPAAAGAMLDDAGWKLNADTGVREKDVDADGTPEPLRLKLCTTSGNPTRLTEVGKLSAYLSAVGIPSDIQTADAGGVMFAGWADTTPDTQCSIYRGTYDIADYAYVVGGDLYSNYFYTYHSSQIPSARNPNGSNDTRLAVPEMDAALDDLATQIDPQKQKADAATIQQTIATQNNEIPLYYRAATTGVSNHVGGWTRFNPSSVGPTWDAERWYFIP